MKLPGIGNVYNFSLKTKNGWKEIQKNSSVAAKKGQNLILDNIRPLGANKDAKARWSISASPKPMNPAAAPRKNNIDFPRLVNNVWPHKASSSTPLKGINDKLKGSLSGTKIANSFFKKTSAVPVRDGDALHTKANNLLGRLKNAEDAVNRSRRDISRNGRRSNIENRDKLDTRLNEVYMDAISAINLSKDRIHKIMQVNPFQRNSSLPKLGLYKNQYNDLKKSLIVLSWRFNLG
ncbi:hypothetical protein KQH60_09820 [Mycetohabitans sp. B8]|uniref:hypothetical protein n=1 Tax=Mycetohabitans sp. B8 TaxID=2841845 RepID=UPI001F4607E3|nr:hypothetical protein [Mycetohabitans sp. B8]MCG1042816.1 hypothetical protein [Mycetohabitans sp. B8]